MAGGGWVSSTAHEDIALQNRHFPCPHVLQGVPLLAMQAQHPSSEGRNKCRGTSVSCANAEQMFQQRPEKYIFKKVEEFCSFLLCYCWIFLLFPPGKCCHESDGCVSGSLQCLSMGRMKDPGCTNPLLG